MPARYEQIGQRAGHEQTMSVLVEPAIAHLGKAEHPLDDPDRMLDPGPHFGLGTIFRPLDLVDNTAVAVATVDKVLGLGGVRPDHRALAAVSLIAPHAGFVAMQQIGQHRAVGDIGWRRHDAPSCPSTTGCPSWSDASRDHAPSWRSWSKTAH